MLKLSNIPEALKQRPSWVLWKMATRRDDDKPTKLPFQVNGSMAKSDDPTTWAEFNAVVARFEAGGYTGVGYEFAKDDPFCGIDLDGCRNPETGEIAEWAKSIILGFNTYAEVSPTSTGVKLFIVGKSPMERGRKKELDVPKVCAKQPAIEVYDWGRYFAVTGLRLKGQPGEPQERQDQLAALVAKHWPEPVYTPSPIGYQSDAHVMERARKYLAKLPVAVSGQGGHNAAFHAACCLVLGFELDHGAALALMREWNQTCAPPWSDRDLEHKVNSAAKQNGPRGYLKNTPDARWHTVNVPRYVAPPALKPETNLITVVDATRSYMASLKAGQSSLIELGISDVDYAIGGGVERGELVIMAARPSHGKSAVAMQCVHQWASRGMGSLIVSEEMSAMALGKRSLQFISDVPQEHWATSMERLESEMKFYEEACAPCWIVESCGTVEAAVAEIDRAVEQKGIVSAVVDYAQLLRAPGKSRYEQVTNTSVALKQCAGRNKIVLLMLCQLSREIEKRNSFVPVMSDIKETGQLEQDADVILFLVWPHRINSSEPAEKFLVFVAKNRNRPINALTVECRFMPSRQMVTLPRVKDHKNYTPEFDHVPDSSEEF